MTTRRDMTEPQFKAALARHGFGEPTGPFMHVQLPNSNHRVSLLNANSNRYRKILAYLLQEKKRIEEQAAATDPRGDEG